MVTLIEKLTNGKVVQKITSPKGKLIHYQSGYPGEAGLMQAFPTLWQARFNVGILGSDQE